MPTWKQISTVVGFYLVINILAFWVSRHGSRQYFWYPYVIVNLVYLACVTILFSSRQTEASEAQRLRYMSKLFIFLIGLIGLITMICFACLFIFLIIMINKSG